MLTSEKIQEKCESGGATIPWLRTIQSEVYSLEIRQMEGPMMDVFNERIRQDDKWGEQNHPDYWWLPIMVEEVGEAAKAMLQVEFGMGGDGEVYKEVKEACATALAWLECMERRETSVPR